MDIQSDFPVEAVRIAEVPRLERVGERERFYINLWPENLFGLAVDGDLCEVPHICAWNPVLVESKFYPFSVQKQPFPMLLSDEGTRFTLENPDQSPPPIRKHRTLVYIPTIPRYINALLSRHPLLASLPDTPRYAGHSSMEISYLIRYLFLENEAQWEKLLPTLAGQRKDVMMHILDWYERTVKKKITLRNSKGMLASRHSG